MQEKQKEYLSIQEFAELLDLHPNTIRRSIKAGKINAVQIGPGKLSEYRIARSEINRLSFLDLQDIVDKMVEDKLNQMKE